jgi:hypothetical protein
MGYSSDDTTPGRRQPSRTLDVPNIYALRWEAKMMVNGATVELRGFDYRSGKTPQEAEKQYAPHRAELASAVKKIAEEMGATISRPFEVNIHRVEVPGFKINLEKIVN